MGALDDQSNINAHNNDADGKEANDGEIRDKSALDEIDERDDKDANSGKDDNADSRNENDP